MDLAWNRTPWSECLDEAMVHQRLPLHGLRQCRLTASNCLPWTGRPGCPRGVAGTSSIVWLLTWLASGRSPCGGSRVGTSRVRKNPLRSPRGLVSSPHWGLERPPSGIAHHQSLSLCNISPTDRFSPEFFRSLLVSD